MSKSKKRFLGIVLTALIMFSCMNINSLAASNTETNKVTAVKLVNIKKSKAIKTGSNKITSKKTETEDYACVKFKAKKAGTYVFTFSNFKSVKKIGDDINLAGVKICKLKDNKPSEYTVKTNYGKTSYLCLGTKYSYNNYYKSKDKTIDTFLFTRKATIKLKKNQTIYILAYFTGPGKFTYNLSVNRLANK